MEMFVNRRSKTIDVSMARFANVAFSMVLYYTDLIKELKKNNHSCT